MQLNVLAQLDNPLLIGSIDGRVEVILVLENAGCRLFLRNDAAGLEEYTVPPLPASSPSIVNRLFNGHRN